MTNRRHRPDGRRISEVYAFPGPDKISPPRLHQSPIVIEREVSLRLAQPAESRSSGNSTILVQHKGPSPIKGNNKKGNQYPRSSTSKSALIKSGHSIGAVTTVGTSSASSESVLSQGDFDRYEAFYEKRRSTMAVITGIFTCWSKSKDGHGESQQLTATPSGPQLNSLTTAALFEQAKAQQEALLETQDTSDMWEWHMEQQQAIASQEHEMLERSRNATSGDQLVSIAPAARLPANSRTTTGDSIRPVIRPRKPPQDELAPSANEDQDDDDGAQDQWGSPAWGWRMQEEIAAEKVFHMFEAALLRFRWEVNTFCRIYMQQIVRSGYSLINTLMEMEANTIFLRRVHASYALEARINAALFRCFENDSFDDSGLTHIFDLSARATSRLQEFVRMKGLDPAEALRMHSPSYEPAFHNFAATKSEEVLSLLPASAMAFRSAAQRDRFMDAFLRAAKCAWLLHRLATSTTPQITILRVARGHPVDPLYVEAVAVPPIGSCARCPVTSIPTVEFMIMPGFVAQRKVFRCRIYQHFMCKQLQ